MSSNKDWEEIEKWNNAQEEKRINKYGIDIMKLEKTNKKIDSATKVIGKIGKTFAIILIIIIIIIVIVAFGLFIHFFKDIQNQLDVDVEKAVEKEYGVEFSAISADTDKNNNGIYQFESKGESKIKFLAIKDWGQYTEDYPSNSLKYYFEKWDNSAKEKFYVEEYREESGLLYYSLYINVETISQIDEAMDLYLELKRLAGEYYTYKWNIEIRNETYTARIAPFKSYSEEESRSSLKRNYVIWHKDHNSNIDKISQEELERYYKPDELQLLVNGEKAKMAQGDDLMVKFNATREDYDIPLYAITEKNKEISTVKSDYGDILEITYKGQKYTVSLETEDIEHFVISSVPSIDTVKQVFGAKVKYDYINRILYLDVE